MHYLYILQSEQNGQYYVGISEDVYKRLREHNNQALHNTFTSKHRPWQLVAVFKCIDKSSAVSIERFIKRQKSKLFLEKLIDENFELTGLLAQLVRVPHMRD